MVSWDALPEAFDERSDSDPEAYMFRQQKLNLLREWLQRLKPDDRELLALRFAAGLTVPQIAEVIGKRPTTVKKQLSHLLQSFKEQHREQL